MCGAGWAGYVVSARYWACCEERDWWPPTDTEPGSSLRYLSIQQPGVGPLWPGHDIQQCGSGHPSSVYCSRDGTRYTGPGCECEHSRCYIGRVDSRRRPTLTKQAAPTAHFLATHNKNSCITRNQFDMITITQNHF